MVGPATLKLGEEAAQGIRQEDILRDDDGASMAEYLQWQGARDRLLNQVRPRFSPFLASQAADSPPGDPVLVDHVMAGDLKRSVSNRRFGILTHASPARRVSLDASPTQIRNIAELNARDLETPPAELKSAAAAVRAALKLPLLDRARAAERCHQRCINRA